MTRINPQWEVSDTGDLICSDYNYEIDHTTLNMDWLELMKEKRWCNMVYFRQAFQYALKIVEDAK